jgi:hypothetical protein
MVNQDHERIVSMKTKIFALALAASMTAGVAFAQTSTTTTVPTQSGGSEATAEQAQRGVPELPSEKMMSNFYTDSTMKTMRSDAELTTYWQGLTPEEQAAARAGCTDEFTAAQRNLPESTLNVCRKVNAM